MVKVIEVHPTLWCDYTPPASNVACLVQMPETQITGRSLSDAYARDARSASRNTLKEPS